MKGYNRGEKNGQWKGGINHDYCKRIAFETYPIECMICHSKEKIEIHHKDRNRKNNDIKNLAILCQSCHDKVHEHLVDWSRNYRYCINCRTNKIKHNAKGYCKSCYIKLFYKDKIKQYYLDNKEEINKKLREKYFKDNTFRNRKLLKQREYNRTTKRKEYLKNYHMMHSRSSDEL